MNMYRGGITLNFDHLNLVKFIEEKELVSHKEITEMFGWSRYITNKYVNEINSYCEETDNKIIIDYEPRLGLSLKGEKHDVEKLLNTLSYTSDGTKEKRVVKILSVLLDTDGFMKIQDLADMFFLSRSSIENTLEEIRSILEARDIKIIGSRNGIKIKLEEDGKRELIANLINSYKSNLVIQNYFRDDFRVTINFSSDIQSLIDLEIINKVIDITNEFMVKTNLYLTEYEFSSLVIHISILIDRVQKKFMVEKSLNDCLETNSKKLVEMIESQFNVKLPIFEQENINIYIKSIQQNNYNKIEYTDVKESTKSNIVKYENDIQELLGNLNPDTELIRDLAIHLRSAINRLKKNMSIRNPYLHEIKTKFIRASEVSAGLASDLEKRYDVRFDEDEIAYITMHIQSFFERVKKSGNSDVILVCTSGYGTSKLLEQRLKNTFGDKINITDIVGLRQFKEMDVKDKIIISTVPVEKYAANIIHVNPLLVNSDIEKIANLLDKRNTTGDSFIRLLSEDLFEINETEVEQNTVITKMVEKLFAKQYVKPGVLESIIERENISSTLLGEIAIPHAKMEYVKEPSISIYINKKGIRWGTGKAKIVFLFLLNEDNRNNIGDVYKYFNKIIDSKELLEKLINSDSYNDFINILFDTKNK